MLTDLIRRVRPDRVGPRTGPLGKVQKSPEERHRAKGHGNWACWDTAELEQLSVAAARWAAELPPGDRYWLCWNTQDDWCRLQQRLVLEVGWTPVVGVDRSQVAEPTILPGAIRLDFQAGLPAPDMWMHFPLELVFEWADRLAFWHSDLLLPLPVMRDYARRFERLAGPVTAAVYSRRNVFRPRSWDNADRWFEVIGCTTREASQGQFQCGGGWWKHFQNHPNCGPVPDLVNYHWDHGGGIRYWQRVHGGEVDRLWFNDRYHVSHYHRPDLRPRGTPLAGVDLEQVADELKIARLLAG
jgi:hypothetical protein